MNNQVLLVLWESYSEGRTNQVSILDRRNAEVLARNFRSQRRRRADVIPLTSDNIKRFVS